MQNNTSDKRFSTEPLDDAMRELLDICQQYNDKQSETNNAPKSTGNSNKCEPLTTSKQIPFLTMSKYTSNTGRRTNEPNCDTNTGYKHSQANESAFRPYGSNNNMARVTTPGNNLLRGVNSESADQSVEMLQQRQGELQSQLDEVMAIAKSLEAKQKRKLTDMFDDEDRRTKFGNSQTIDLDDDDDELIEFQQIENELRISELKRQLSIIEEELRIRLYKRLLTKTTNGSKPTRERHNNNALSNTSDPSDTSARRNSTQTDESTPPSSSCSDEQNATSTTSTSDTISSSNPKIATSNSDRAQQSSILAKEIEIDAAIRRFQLFDEKSNQLVNDAKYQTENRNEAFNSRADARPETKTKDLLSSALGDCPNLGNQENIAHCLKLSTRATSQIPTSTRNQIEQEPMASDAVDNCVQNNNMNINGTNQGGLCSNNNDLERIDEGDEEDIEYYANSNVYRSIYEEKISPMIQAGYNSNNRNNNTNSSSNNNNEIQHDDNNRSHSSANSSRSDNSIKKSTYEECFNSPTPNINTKDYRFQLSNINSAKRGNRPLTLYMPKPDEDIDLKELIQSMGHDLEIMENDLSVSPSSAHGYLYKSCSSNAKKWLKRFFYFDRLAKTLSYYETEEQLVKKSSAPKCTIPFDDISDVYVDHRLNDISEKQKDSKRRSCFVLATTKRKYVLATPRAEIMRAWIDILFTAAKANDYFQAIENEEASFIGCLDSLPE